MRKCESTRNIYMNSRKTRKGTRVKQYKSTHEFTKGNSRDSQGGLEGWSSGRSAGDPRYRCATLISNREEPRSKLHDLDMRIQGSQ